MDAPAISYKMAPMQHLVRHAPRWLIALGLACSLWGDPAAAKERVHTVYSGQRLGSIAKRYNVTVDELCAANGISRRDPIRPGQKLVIPDKGAPPKQAKSAQNGSASPGKPQRPRVHVVSPGHTLSAIGGRYAVTVGALCHANGIKRNAALTVGQRLVIPAKDDKDGSYARKLRLQGFLDTPEREIEEDKDVERGKSKAPSWVPYVKPAWRRGYIKIRRYGRFWEGYVIGPKENVLGHASNKINFVMGAREDGPKVDPRLIRLIAHVSDKFGGRELRIVSGYRTKSFVAASKHKEGRAIDFSIPGIPNEVLRDYLRTLDDVGVGYYPNSSFVHLDVRGYNAYWIDYAGPGEAPRKVAKSAARRGPKSSLPEDEHEHGPDDSPSADADTGGADAPGDGPDAPDAAPAASPDDPGSRGAASAEDDAARAED